MVIIPVAIRSLHIARHLEFGIIENFRLTGSFYRILTIGTMTYTHDTIFRFVRGIACDLPTGGINSPDRNGIGRMCLRIELAEVVPNPAITGCHHIYCSIIIDIVVKIPSLGSIVGRDLLIYTGFIFSVMETNIYLRILKSRALGQKIRNIDCRILGCFL